MHQISSFILVPIATLLISTIVPQVATSQEVDYDNGSQCFQGGWSVAGNASAIDVDGDGDKDLLISTFDFGDYDPDATGMAWSREGTVGPNPWFVNRSDAWFSSGQIPRENVFGFLCADYNNDGTLDLYCPNPYGAVLYENQSGILTDVSTHSPDLVAHDNTIGATWADVDGDTYLDLLILESPGGYNAQWTNYSSNMQRILMSVLNPDYYEGSDLPERIFEEPTIPLIIGVVEIGSVLSADFDGDYDVDFILMQANPNAGFEPRYFENRMNVDGTFSDQTVAKLSSIADYWDNWRTAGMVVDVNNDGALDIFYSTNGYFGYVLNNGSGVMSPGEHSYLGSYPTDVGVMDFDLDGRFDFVKGRDNSSVYRPLVFANILVEGDIVLSEVGSSIGLGEFGPTYGLCLADFTSNGLTETVYCRSPNKFLYVPQFEQGYSNNWIGLDVRSLGGLDNRYCVGATVKVDDGVTTRTRIVDGGSGRASQQDLSLVFGLGDHSGTVDVAVALPSGRMRTFSGLAANQYHTLNTEDNLLEVGSVNLTVIHDIHNECEKWKVEWITNYESDQSKDGVTYTVTQGDPFEKLNGTVLDNPTTVTGATEVTNIGNGQYLHTYILDNILCSPNRTVMCEVESWLGDFKMSGDDSHRVRFCLQRL